MSIQSHRGISSRTGRSLSNNSPIKRSPLILFFICLFLSTATFLPAGETEEELWEILNSKKNRTTPSRQSRREVAIHKLARKDSVKAAKCLARVLADPFHHIRQEAVLWMIQEFRSEEPIRWLATRATHARDPIIRANVVRTLGGFDPSSFPLSNLSRLASDPVPKVRLEVARALGFPDLDKAPDALFQLSGDPDPEVAAAALSSLGKIKDPDSVSLLKKRIRSTTGIPRAEACLSLARAQGEIARKTLKDYLNDSEWPVRMMALRGIYEASGTDNFLKKDMAFECAVKALSDSNWRVVANAIDVLVNIWEVRVIPALIKHFEGVEGRLVIDYMKALQVMTRKTIESDPLAWKGWWETHEASFELGKKPDNWKKGVKKTKPKNATTTFFNIPLYSRRIVFIMDFSGGMANPAKGKKDRGLSKLDLAKEELTRTIQRLKDHHRINLVIYRYFSEFPPKTVVQSPFGNRIIAASNSVKRHLAGWLKDKEALGWGAFYEAFATAAKIQEADTLIFLSDGVPTRGKHACITATGREHFFKALKRENRYSQLMIHTVLTGKKGTDKKFMKQIADLTGGYFDQR